MRHQQRTWRSATLPGLFGAVFAQLLVIALPASGQTITTVAGNGNSSYSGDGGAATAAQLGPLGLALDSGGNLYVADSINNRVRKVTPLGIISTVAGNGNAGFAGDGGAALGAELNDPAGVALDSQGNLYIADFYNSRVRRVAPSGVISTVAGNGTIGSYGDGGPATAAALSLPTGVAVDQAGNLYIADGGAGLVRKVTATGIISTVAGNGTYGFSGDGGPATAAELNAPSNVALDSAGNLYIADVFANCVRKVSTTGVISTVAGNGNAGYSGDGGLASAALLNGPFAVAVDSQGTLYIADTNNNRVRAVTPAGLIKTAAGDGNAGYAGDGGPATLAEVDQPSAVIVDTAGELYISDGTNRVRKVTAPLTPLILATPASLSFTMQDGGAPPPTQTLSISSAGTALTFTAGTSTASGANWLFISPTGTLTTPAALTVVAYPTGLALGTYRGTVNLYASGASNSPLAVNISLTVTAPPVLTIQEASNGAFVQGQPGSYTITVANAATGGATNGIVTVTDTVPSGLALVSMAGSGWNCSGASCTRSDSLAPGSGYPSITVNVTAASTAPSQVTNLVTVSGGGAASAAASNVTSVASSSIPFITSVANAAGEGTAVAQNTWIEIYGINLSPDTRQWQSTDFISNQMPTRLDGVSVTVNGHSAYVYYISSMQVNVLTPLDSTQGTVQVQLSNNGLTSAAFPIQLQSYAPGLFEFSGSAYAAATHANGSLLGPASLYPGSTTPATPGEVITLYGNGFGQTSPPVVNGSATQTGVLPVQPVVSIGGTTATVEYAGVVGPGLYQINVYVPATTPPGDASVQATYNGVASNTARLTVSAPSLTGSLQISIGGLPNGVAPNVSITSSAGFSASVTGNQTLQVAPGSYTVVANSIPAGNVTYGAFPVQQTVSVQAGGVSPVQVSYSTVIPNTTMVLDQQGIQGLSVSTDGSTVTLPAASPVAQSLVPGSVLAIGVTPATPYGSLNKIVSVSQTGSQIVAQTTQATLLDAFQQANFTFNTTFPTPSPQASRALRRGVTISRRPLQNHRLALKNPLDSAEIPCSSDTSLVMQMFDTPIVDDPNGTITVNGEIEICPSFEFDWSITPFPPSLHSLTATATLGEDIQVTMSGSYQNGFNQEVDLATIVTDPVTVFVGPVPLVLTPSLTLFVGASGSVNAGFSTGVTQTASITGGISYANGQASPVFTQNANFAQDPLALDASASVKADAGVTIALNIDGVLSPEFSPDAYLQMSANINANPWWTLTAGLEGDAAVKVGIFGLSKDFDFPGLFDFSTPIAQASGGFTGSGAAPVLSSISPTSAPAGSAATTLTFTGSNFVPGATAYFNSTVLVTTYVSTQQLTAMLPASSLTTAGAYAVTVKNPDTAGLSGSQSFVVQAVVTPNPTPTISSLAPSSVSVGTQSLLVTINGIGFLPSSTVTFNGVSHVASYISSGQLTVTLGATDLRTAGSFAVVVTNPAPGGGPSNAAAFAVTSGIPAGFTISTAVGDGTCSLSHSGDGGPATKATLCYPTGVALDGAGNVYVSDGDRVRQVTPKGTITTFAGGGNGCAGQSDSLGDGCPATSAVLTGVQGLAADTAGRLYISDNGVRIRLVSPNGVITTVGGSINGNVGYSGDNGPATSALFDDVAGIALDTSGNLYIADEENNVIRKISPAGIITTVVGNGYGGFSGDGGPATSARLDSPSGVAVGPAGDLYIADSYNQRIRSVSAGGTITTFAGTGAAGAGAGGFSGDGGSAVLAYLNVPGGVAVDPLNSVYIADLLNNRIRRVLPNGVIATVAGSGPAGFGTGGYGGDGGAATSALMNYPEAVAIDAAGDVYVGDSGNNVIRLLKPNGQTVVPTNPLPTIGNLSPSTAQAGANSLTLTVNGTNFLPASVVTFNAVVHPATIVSSSELTITLSASDLASVGAFPVVVTNPVPGGGASNSSIFTVSSAATGTLLGKLFGIEGTISLSGKTMSIEIQGACDTSGPCTVTVDDELSVASSPIQFTFALNSSASTSGSTVTFNGAVTTGLYTDSSQDIVAAITSVTLTINFTSFTSGSSVTGSLNMITASGSHQGTFTGTATTIN